MRRRSVLITVLAFVLFGAGPVRANDVEPHVATVRTAHGSFRAVVRDPAMIERARLELEGRGDAGVPTGRLAWGDGDVNKGHVWHVVELGFADVTVELCDGTAKAVDRDPGYWVETVGFFCPWSGEVVKLRPLRMRD